MEVSLFLFEKRKSLLIEQVTWSDLQTTFSLLCCKRNQRWLPEASEAFLVFSPGAVEADGPIKPLLNDGPPSTKRLHVAEDLECPVAWVRGDAVHAVLLRLQHVVVRAVPRGHHVCKQSCYAAGCNLTFNNVFRNFFTQSGDHYGIERYLRVEYRKRNGIKKSILSIEEVLINFLSILFKLKTASPSSPKQKHGHNTQVQASWCTHSL